jgi:hypothetical protein
MRRHEDDGFAGVAPHQYLTEALLKKAVDALTLCE